MIVISLLPRCEASFCGSLNSARGTPKRQRPQVRKRAASSGSLPVCRCVEFHVACVLWERLCLSGLSCGQSGIDFSCFRRSFDRGCELQKSPVALGGAVHSTEALSVFLSGTAASWRPVFNSALMMEDFCEATSKMLISP